MQVGTEHSLSVEHRLSQLSQCYVKYWHHIPEGDDVLRIEA